MHHGRTCGLQVRCTPTTDTPKISLVVPPTGVPVSRLSEEARGELLLSELKNRNYAAALALLRRGTIPHPSQYERDTFMEECIHISPVAAAIAGTISAHLARLSLRRQHALDSRRPATPNSRRPATPESPRPATPESPRRIMPKRQRDAAAPDSPEHPVIKRIRARAVHRAIPLRLPHAATPPLAVRLATTLIRRHTHTVNGRLRLRATGVAFRGGAAASNDLLRAAETGCVVSILACIDAKVCVNTRSASGDTPLHVAARNGHAIATLVLLEHAANPMIANQAADTPLCVAVRAGHSDVAQILIGSHPKVVKDDRALFLAFLHDRAQLVRTMLSFGFDPNGSGAVVPYHAVAISSRERARRVDYSQLDMYRFHKGHGNIMQYALHAGDFELAAWLIANGYDISRRIESGVTLAHIFAKFGSAVHIEWLSAYGADFTAPSYGGVTPLAAATAANNVATVEAIARIVERRNPAHECRLDARVIAARASNAQIMDILRSPRPVAP